MQLGQISEKWLTILSKWGLFGGQKLENWNFVSIVCLRNNVELNVAIQKTKGTLEYVHLDLNLKSPSQRILYSGGRCMLIFIDDYSRKDCVYILKYKNDIFEKLKKWKVVIEKHIRKTNQVFRNWQWHRIR